MNNLNNPSKVFIKSENNYTKIINKYNTSLIIFTIITIIINIFIGNKDLSISLIKSLLISFISISIFSYIINIIKKEYNILKLYTEDSIISISIIIAFFGININIYILILAILLTLIIKNTIKNINISSSLYGILLIILYKYFNSDIDIPLSLIKSLSYKEIIEQGGGITNYLFGISYVNPILSIISFLYLFHHKSIKYNLVFSYILTFSLVMLLYGLFSDIGIWFILYELFTGSILFLSVYTLTDYRMTPTISEGNIIYGIILAIISSILRLIISELSIVLTFILGPFLLTNLIDKISPKLKYNNKLYIGLIISLIALIILLTLMLTVFL